MPLTKATLEVIDISSISDGLANDFDNTDGILAYITNQIDTYDVDNKLYIDMSIDLLQNQITQINDNLIASGISASTIGVMNKTENLAGLQNLTASRNNLGIYSASTSVSGLISISIDQEYSLSGPANKAATPLGVATYVSQHVNTLQNNITTIDDSTLKTANYLSEYTGDAIAQNTIRNNLGIINPGVSTTSVSGMVILANSSDVLHDTGTNTSKAITPQLLKSGTAAYLYRNKDITRGEINPLNSTGEYSSYIEFANGYTICTIKKSLNGLSYPYTISLPISLNNIHGSDISLDFSGLVDPLTDTKLISGNIVSYNTDTNAKYISVDTMYIAEGVSGIERPTTINDNVFVQIKIYGSRGTIV